MEYIQWIKGSKGSEAKACKMSPTIKQGFANQIKRALREKTGEVTVEPVDEVDAEEEDDESADEE